MGRRRGRGREGWEDQEMGEGPEGRERGNLTQPDGPVFCYKLSVYMWQDNTSQLMVKTCPYMAMLTSPCTV